LVYFSSKLPNLLKESYRVQLLLIYEQCAGLAEVIACFWQQTALTNMGFSNALKLCYEVMNP